MKTFHQWNVERFERTNYNLKYLEDYFGPDLAVVAMFVTNVISYLLFCWLFPDFWLLFLGMHIDMFLVMGSYFGYYLWHRFFQNDS